MALVIEPLGIFPLGQFDPGDAEHVQPPPVIRADSIDPTTREFLSLLNDTDPTDALVIECLVVSRESGALVFEKGNLFGEVTKVSDEARLEIASYVELALSKLTASNAITLEKVSVELGDDWIEVTVDYKNNKTTSLDKNRSKTVRMTR